MSGIDTGPQRRGTLVAGAGGVALLGLVAVVAAIGLRFHVENTDAALADESRGGLWLLGAAVLLVLATVLASLSGAPRWSVVLIASPIVIGIVPMLLVPGNIVPFGLAVLSGVLCLVGIVGLAVSARRR